MSSHSWRRINQYSLCDSSSPYGVQGSDLHSAHSFCSGSQHDTSRQRVSSRWLSVKLSNTLFRIAWATVIHMSYEGDGIRIRNLAKSTGDPTSPLPAFHIFRSRFGNQETSRRSRKSYESVPRSPSAPRLLTLPQQTTLVSVLSIIRRPRHPGCSDTLPVRTCRGDQNFCRRTYHRPASFLDFLIVEQNKRKVYREVLIAGDLSKEDIDRAGAQRVTLLRYGGITSDTAELVYNNDTVYFAQPSISQFIPGGVGAGTFNTSASIGRGNTQDNALGRASGNRTISNDNGVVLRYARACSLEL